MIFKHLANFLSPHSLSTNNRPPAVQSTYGSVKPPTPTLQPVSCITPTPPPSILLVPNFLPDDNLGVPQKTHTVDCSPISSRNPRILVFSSWIPAVALIQGLPRASLSFKRFFHRNLILWRHKAFARKPVESNTPYHINYLISD